MTDIISKTNFTDRIQALKFEKEHSNLGLVEGYNLNITTTSPWGLHVSEIVCNELNEAGFTNFRVTKINTPDFAKGKPIEKIVDDKKLIWIAEQLPNQEASSELSLAWDLHVEISNRVFEFLTEPSAEDRATIDDKIKIAVLETIDTERERLNKINSSRWESVVASDKGLKPR